ncbi:bifunctional 4-hydroxy-2-oxoglutarate aldolase/2-dehydro-3-deoxy-phosphogluconate aldolase [Paenibacillus sp. N1-5-1-14]|uniref:bifunctional 4-hydroxy-2-oxoglutarate aldolase/2-dehydro-3-deoxy-phosphogluconate aldolase n=1 Tax=Paenibacillus radicibacter TaxID=2972488 RepID=UPI0021599AFC|nr:bifunctional 4-hydroxy-2-oxoglutarate aldolase/2-dehydro-3-deoxy-phosphogluconate aldolase [Paenibacillus radicibacter]MCR8643830.1 bifunctional 4-hydroxy-2-oxoglutarate aldolase/2-dehydro-3-deoxy-phosphogluconate aldolase [Paenibacillus radicibacter]
MNKEQGLQLLEQTRVIAIVRGVEQKHISAVAGALLAGGISVMEVTLNTPGATDMIKELQANYSDKMFIGAGTVLDMDDAKLALDAGAAFFVTPNTDEDVIRFAAEHSIPIYPGAMTPTEVVKAWKAGATAVKLFPTGSLGLTYFKDVQGPLSHIPMLAVGGVRTDNIADYFAAGCYGFGVGGSLFNKEDIAAGRYESVTNEARKVTDCVQACLK